jgi:hypothetical protein
MSKKNNNSQSQILELPEETSIISHYDCNFEQNSLDDSILNLSSEQLIKANFPQVNNDNQAIKTAITTQKTTKEQRAEEEKHFKSLIATSLQTLTVRKKARDAIIKQFEQAKEPTITTQKTTQEDEDKKNLQIYQERIRAKEEKERILIEKELQIFEEQRKAKEAEEEQYFKSLIATKPAATIQKKAKDVRKIDIDAIFARFVNPNLGEFYCASRPLEVSNANYALKRFDFNLIYLANRLIADQMNRYKKRNIPFKSNNELAKVRLKDGTIKQLCSRYTIIEKKKFLTIFGVEYIERQHSKGRHKYGQGCDMVYISPLRLKMLKKFVKDNLTYHHKKFVYNKNGLPQVIDFSYKKKISNTLKIISNNKTKINKSINGKKEFLPLIPKYFDFWQKDLMKSFKQNYQQMNIKVDFNKFFSNYDNYQVFRDYLLALTDNKIKPFHVETIFNNFKQILAQENQPYIYLNKLLRRLFSFAFAKLKAYFNCQQQYGNHYEIKELRQSLEQHLLNDKRTSFSEEIKQEVITTLNKSRKYQDLYDRLVGTVCGYQRINDIRVSSNLNLLYKALESSWDKLKKGVIKYKNQFIYHSREYLCGLLAVTRPEYWYRHG